MKSFWLLITVAVTVTGQTVSRLGSYNPIQKEELQSWFKLRKSIETTLEDLYVEDDGRQLGPIQQFFHDLLAGLLSSSYPTAVGNVSQQCQIDSIHYVHNLYRSTWAMQSKFKITESTYYQSINVLIIN